MSPALLLIDLQQEFLRRPGLQPTLADLSGPLERLLRHARSVGMPVGHIRSRLDTTGRDRMPHWQDGATTACVSGSGGAEPPPQFEALDSEPVFYTQFHSGFSDPGLDGWVRAAGIRELWIAGVYTDGCVRATVLDACQRGYRVSVVEDGVASTDPLHGRLSRDYLQARAARFATSWELIGEQPTPDEHHNPDNPREIVARAKNSSTRVIDRAVETACRLQKVWEAIPMSTRRELVSRFANLLAEASSLLEDWLVRDLGKPRRDARDELRRATGHVESALQLLDRENLDDVTEVVYKPHGVVALVTPWNNPVAIPAGKLAAALVLGNGVVWKPAYQAERISHYLLERLGASGLPAGLVQLVDGGSREAVSLASHPDIAAVSLTGPESAGTALTGVCGSVGKPLQAELGGNNALLVLADANVEDRVSSWARQAFGFSGQRCTALRRFVVERAIVDRFERVLRDAVAQLQVTGPGALDCDVGPLISEKRLCQVETAVDAALQRGARLLLGGGRVEGVDGWYYQPTLLADLPAEDPLVQEELFGPVALLQLAENFDDGLALVNGVRQGLLASIATESPVRRAEFVQRAEAGIILDGGEIRLHPSAPFGGVKASQIGPPEHGLWDRQFFSRVRTVYRTQ